MATNHAVIIAGRPINPDELEWRTFEKLPVAIKAMRIDIPFRVETPNWVINGNPGDWLIMRADGQCYPCRDDIFRKTYKEVTNGI